MAAEREWVLPIGVVAVSDISRMQREAELVDNFLRQDALTRKSGEPTQIPKTSQLFIDMINQNQINVIKEQDRKELAKFLDNLRKTAPLLHVSFNAAPSPLFLQRLTMWLRQNIHRHVILQVGRHPAIGIGCAVRTNNKYYDFSLRQHFIDQKKVLIERLRGDKNQRQTEAPPAKQVQIATEPPKS